MSSNGLTLSDLNYDEASASDFVNVDAVPERRGVVIKHVEYAISSKKLGAQVHRRYKDFLAFRELLLLRFSYRIIPKLPPKKLNLVVDADSVEERRKCLQRFLNFIVRHPTMGSDVLVKHFLTVQERDIYQTMKNHFATLPDEFFVHPGSLKAHSLINENTARDYKRHRENVNQVLLALSKLHDIILARVNRYEADASDLRDIDKLLKELAGSNTSTPSSPVASQDLPPSSPLPDTKYILAGVPKWLTEKELEMIENVRSNVSQVASRFTSVATCTSEKARSEENKVLDKLSLIIDIIHGYQELCQRHEKGVTSEHHRAIRQLNNLKKLTSGTSPGLAESQQNLEAIERTVHQQEAEIATIEQRNAFALYCVQEETRLVYCHMALLNGIMGDLAETNAESLGELSTIWRGIRNCVVPEAPEIRVTSPKQRQQNSMSSRK